MVTIPRRTTSRYLRTPQPVDTSEIEAHAAKWYTNYQLKKQIEKEQEKEGVGNQGYRQWLLDKIVKVGRKLPGGHKAIVFERPVGGLYGLKAQRSTTPEWQQMVAAGLLRKKGGDVLKACTATQWAFRSDKVDLIVEALKDYGVLEECVQEGYPKEYLDPDLVLRYHQLHKDVITKKDMELMLPDKVTWSIHPLTEPLGDLPDVD